jgi:hypothetical protein
MLLGNVAVGLQIGMTVVLVNKSHWVRTLGLPSLFLVPILAGVIASYIWRTLKPTVTDTLVSSLWTTLMALAIATVVFHEGFICLLILSPIYFVAVLAGALVGRVLFKVDRSRLHLCLIPAMAVVTLVEPMTRKDELNVITDEIVIRAPPAKVWPLVTAFPQIPAEPGFWLFRLGLPYPESTTTTGPFVDADRRCIFSGNAVFKERVVEFVPSEKLTFDIIELPPDPELVGHLTPHRGQFVLRGNSDGSTTLSGSTWYTLHVRPAWYFDLWTQQIFRAVHLRVMEDIRRRAELPDRP